MDLRSREGDHFREAVFAACPARQYHEYFEGDGFTRREDLGHLSLSVCLRELAAPLSTNAVLLVAMMAELEAAVRARLRPAAPNSPERRQEVALTDLQATLSWYLAHTGRHGLAARTAAQNTTALESRFGPGGARFHLHPHNQRVYAAVQMGLQRPTEATVRDLVALSEAAERQRSATEAVTTLTTAPGFAARFDHPAARAALRDRATAGLERVGDELGDLERAEAHVQLFEVSVVDGSWDEAERLASGFADWKEKEGGFAEWWAPAMGRFALERGDHAEARQLYERALAVARQRDVDHIEPDYMGFIQACEDAAARAARSRRRSVRATGASC